MVSESIHWTSCLVTGDSQLRLCIPPASNLSQGHPHRFLQTNLQEKWKQDSDEAKMGRTDYLRIYFVKIQAWEIPKTPAEQRKR